jgi:hypothetical protein
MRGPVVVSYKLDSVLDSEASVQDFPMEEFT